MHKNGAVGPRMNAHLESKARFASLVEPLLTQDGLLPCKNITVSKHGERHNLFLAGDNLPLFPAPFNLMTANYLASHASLWELAALRVTYYSPICGSAPIFGVPFRKAVNIALSKGLMRSKFYFPKRMENGHYETLLMQLDKTNDSSGELLQLQTWQYTPGTRHAHYLHALSHDFKTHVCHLDGAMIEFSDEDLELFLQKSRKVKGDSYEKFFRLDGMIEVEHMHNLAKTFFMTDDLYDEAFEVTDLSSPYT
jgi:hypothetical protein